MCGRCNTYAPHSGAAKAVHDFDFVNLGAVDLAERFKIYSIYDNVCVGIFTIWTLITPAV